jgi:hypothetical protein
MTVTTNKAVLPQTPLSRTAVATAAETTFSAPTGAVDLLLAADNTNGARITHLHAISRGAVAAANNCQLYKRSGSVYTLINSVLMASHTPSASVANVIADFGYTKEAPLELLAGEGLAVATGAAVTGGLAFFANGGLY